MKAPTTTGFALFGAALVAISYGLAHFAFGLFVPPIREELGLSAQVIGTIGALPLISFVLASLVAPFLADRLGARYTALLSGAFGVAGLSLISLANEPLELGTGVFACGICTGLMMPALTAAMQALINRTLHGRVSSVLNAGTSIGIIVAVPAVLFLADGWRLAYASFVGLAALGLIATWFSSHRYRLWCRPLPHPRRRSRRCNGLVCSVCRCLPLPWVSYRLPTGSLRQTWRSI